MANRQDFRSRVSIVALKSLLLLFDAGTAAIIALLLRQLRLPPLWLLIYWWNPVAINAFANEAHLDSIALFFVALFLYLLVCDRVVPAGVALGLAIGAKFWPIVLAGGVSAAIAAALVVYAGLVSLGVYGRACLTGCHAARNAGIVVFLDGDLSDYPERMEKFVRPIAEGRADFVLGSRRQGLRECGALLPQQQFGGWLACALIRLFWRHRYTDLGPFRAIRTDSLQRLRMDDENFGWTVQMQIRAVVAGLRIMEIPVDYRRRIGRSKISGTVRGVLGAGIKIFYTIGRELITYRRRING